MGRTNTHNTKPNAMKIIAYYRVSTKRQEESGLGLEGQKAAVEGFAQANRAVIVASYVEVESGRKADRPKLALALAHAKRSKATLVVAKLDRLARNVAFLSAIMDSGVDFIACDNPHANRLTIHILAAVAEDEARRISDRTKAALAAAKARGAKLGSARPGHWKGREERRLAGSVAGAAAAADLHRKAASEAYTDLSPIIAELRGKGCTQLQIAAELNKLGHTTRRGKSWNHVQVGRLLQRMAAD
jgi:DNA invertase Pin-like site-specific DNA recombinase